MCGGHFYHTVIPLLTTSPQTVSQPPNSRVSSELIRCPICPSAISADFIWCPKCGSALNAHLCCPGYISRPPGFKGVRIVSQDLGLAQQRIRWRIT
jgi:predicted amidophosphoribosyltransferase